MVPSFARLGLVGSKDTVRRSDFTRRGLALVAAALLVFGVAGCSSGGDSTPSCSDAVSHNYAMGCALSVNGNSLSETDAVNGCYMSQGKTSGGSCSCAKEFNAVLSCMNTIGQGQCNACDNQLAALDGCMGSCP